MIQHNTASPSGQENPFAHIFDNIVDGIVITDIQTRKFSLCNQTFCRMLGYTKEEITTMGISDIHPAESMEHVNRMFGLLINKDIDLARNIPVLKKDGAVFFADITASTMIYNEKLHAVGIFRDVTEYKKAEEALEHSEELLKTTLNTTADGILVIDSNGRISHCNRQFIDMWKIPAELIALKDDAKLIDFVANQLCDPEGFKRTTRELYAGQLESSDEISFRDGRVFERFTSPILIRGERFGRVWDFRDITRKKEAADIIAESEKRYRTLFEEAAVAIAISRKGNMVFVNKRFIEMFGYDDPSEIVGKTIFDFVAPESKPEVQYRHENTPYDLKKMNPSYLEAVMLHKNGSKFWINAAISNVILPDGMASLAFISNITPQKEAETALRENEERLRELYRMVQLGQWVWDVKTGAVEWSEEVFNIFHLDPETFTPDIDSILELSPWPEDHTRDKELIRRAMESREKGTYEQRFLLPDKSTGYYQSTFQGKYDESGALVSIVGTILDITDIRKSQEALKKNEAILKSLFNATPVGLGLLLNGRFTKTNNALCSIMGYSEGEILGKDMAVLFPSNRPEFDRVAQELQKQISREGIGITESRFTNKNGRDINVMVFLSPFNIEDTSLGTTISILDITDQKKIESEKRHLEEMLLHSQKLESIGRLAGGIAHDFNNLLTAILGNTELALEQLDPAGEPYSLLKVVMSASEGAANLTRQLLAFSRKQVIEPKIINVNTIIEHIRKMILTLIGENIQLDIIFAPDLHNVRADPGQIEQVLINLSANARDAMPEGGRLIIETTNIIIDDQFIFTHINGEPGPYVMIAVSDTGMGMSKETRDRLFEPFFTTKEIGRGTGLGLATIYGIIKQVGGSIDVYSEIGTGTVFKIYLPATHETESGQMETSRQGTVFAGTETILIAEDNAQVLEFSSTVLNHSGYKILTAHSGEEALTLAEKYPEVIHLFITDIILPGINGRAAAEALVKNRPAIRVLYNSGYTAEVIDKQGILEEGINFISKPFTAQEIRRKVREVLDMDLKD